jgi:hypothetical protein
VVAFTAAEWVAVGSTAVEVESVVDTVAAAVEVTGKFKFEQTFP